MHTLHESQITFSSLIASYKSHTLSLTLLSYISCNTKTNKCLTLTKLESIGCVNSIGMFSRILYLAYNKRNLQFLKTVVYIFPVLIKGKQCDIVKFVPLLGQCSVIV